MKSKLLRSIFFICYQLAVTKTSTAQLNLVPDPSFEDTTSFVDGWGTTSLKYWHNLDSTKYHGGTPFVYFSYYTQASGYKLPDNQWCYQNSRNGIGIAQFEDLWLSGSTFKRSLARTKLKQKLIAGENYCAKIYLNPCEKWYGFFTDAFQLYLDNGHLDSIVAIDSIGPYAFVNPQVSNSTGNILNDTLNWIPLSGIFTSNGTEEYLTIGNFKSDIACTRVFNLASFLPPDTIYMSGMLADDISVIPISATNWLHDTSCILGDSVYIGLPQYEYTDGMWYDINMNYLGKGSGIKVKPTQWATKYIMQIDLCGIIRSDTLTVWAAPDGINEYNQTGFSVFPNPATDKITICYYGAVNNNTEVILYNTIGQCIKKIRPSNSGFIEIPVSDLTRGVYYLKCGVNVKKFVKE